MASKTVRGVNDLASSHPHLRDEWDFERNTVDFSEVATFSNKLRWWRCIKDPRHPSWEAKVVGRTANGRGCSYCSRQKVLPEESLAAEYPNLMLEWTSTGNRIDPYTIPAGSSYEAHWTCIKDPEHQWKVPVFKRTGRGDGCPYCRGLKVLPKDSLQARFPELMVEWDWTMNKIDPNTLATISGKDVYWVCSKNSDHRWRTKTYSRTRQGTGCPKCSLQKTSRAESILREGLRTFFPEISTDHTDKVAVANGKRLSVDMHWVYGGDRFVCEYDGAFWHQNRVDQDTAKTLHLLEAGYSVIRVRESKDSSKKVSLGCLNIEHSRLLQTCAPYEIGNGNLSIVIEEIRDWVYGLYERDAA